MAQKQATEEKTGNKSEVIEEDLEKFPPDERRRYKEAFGGGVQSFNKEQVNVLIHKKAEMIAKSMDGFSISLTGGALKTFYDLCAFEFSIDACCLHLNLCETTLEQISIVKKDEDVRMEESEEAQHKKHKTTTAPAVGDTEQANNSGEASVGSTVVTSIVAERRVPKLPTLVEGVFLKPSDRKARQRLHDQTLEEMRHLQKQIKQLQKTSVEGNNDAVILSLQTRFHEISEPAIPQAAESSVDTKPVLVNKQTPSKAPEKETPEQRRIRIEETARNKDTPDRPVRVPFLPRGAVEGEEITHEEELYRKKHYRQTVEQINALEKDFAKTAQDVIKLENDLLAYMTSILKVAKDDMTGIHSMVLKTRARLALVNDDVNVIGHQMLHRLKDLLIGIIREKPAHPKNHTPVEEKPHSMLSPVRFSGETTVYEFKIMRSMYISMDKIKQHENTTVIVMSQGYELALLWAVILWKLLDVLVTMATARDLSCMLLSQKFLDMRIAVKDRFNIYFRETAIRRPQFAKKTYDLLRKLVAILRITNENSKVDYICHRIVNVEALHSVVHREIPEAARLMSQGMYKGTKFAKKYNNVMAQLVAKNEIMQE